MTPYGQRKHYCEADKARSRSGRLRPHRPGRSMRKRDDVRAWKRRERFAARRDAALEAAP